MRDLNRAVNSLFLNFTLESPQKHSQLPEAWKRDQAAYRLSDCFGLKKRKGKKPSSGELSAGQHSRTDGGPFSTA